jgi:RNA polymerase sigma-70 factor (ECF subfamily)
MDDGIEPSDVQLVQRVARGDRQAGSALVARHEKGLWLFLWRMTGDREATEDLFQQTWLNVWRRLGEFRGEAAFRTFLLRVGRNLAVDRIRSRARQPAPDAPDAPQAAAAPPDADEQLAGVRDAMDALSLRQREALVLHYLCELPFAQAAAMMHVGEATARHYAHEAVRIVRGELRRRGLMKDEPTDAARDI